MICVTNNELWCDHFFWLDFSFKHSFLFSDLQHLWTKYDMLNQSLSTKVFNNLQLNPHLSSISIYQIFLTGNILNAATTMLNGGEWEMRMNLVWNDIYLLNVKFWKLMFRDRFDNNSAMHAFRANFCLFWWLFSVIETVCISSRYYRLTMYSAVDRQSLPVWKCGTISN